ncbi:hypothetical protein D3C77_493730 [compost metagenome]
MFINDATQGFDGLGLTQCQVERVNVSPLPVEHSADIVVAGDHLANGLAIEQLQVLITVALPEPLLRLQMIHLLGGERREYPAVLQIALDAIAGHAIANDAPTFKRHLADQLGFFCRNTVFHGVDVTAVAVDDLPAIATRGAKAHLDGFQHSDLEAVLQQEKCSGKAGVASADHADIGLDITL